MNRIYSTKDLLFTLDFCTRLLQRTHRPHCERLAVIAEIVKEADDKTRSATPINQAENETAETGREVEKINAKIQSVLEDSREQVIRSARSYIGAFKTMQPAILNIDQLQPSEIHTLRELIGNMSQLLAEAVDNLDRAERLAVTCNDLG